MTISHVDSSDRSCTMTNVHRLSRSSVLAMLSAFRGERCGSRQSSEALTLTLARIWSRVSTDNSNETEGTSAKRTLFLPTVETASVDHPLTTPCVDARQLREPADTQETLVTHDRVTRNGRIIDSSQIPMNNLK